MKTKKTFWENIFGLPSFNKRFFTFCFIFLLISFIIISQNVKKYQDPILQFSIINIGLQIITLLGGIFAVFFAFRQLIENRFDKFVELAEINLRHQDYQRAIRYFKEAYYIKQEFGLLANFLEAYLITGAYKEFDETLNTIEKTGEIKTLFLEEKEEVIYLYLKIFRYILEEDIGKTKKMLQQLIGFIQQNPSVKEKPLSWSFVDIIRGESYKKLTGESKVIADNVLKYLEKTLTEMQKEEFEKGNYILRGQRPNSNIPF